MKIKSLELFGMLFVVLIGGFLHFAYDLSDNNQFVALIAPVNESIWEHLKMAFYGVLIYGAIECIFKGGDQKNFLFAKVFGAIVASLLLVVLFYGYTNFMDQALWMDIFIFVVAVVFAQLISLGIITSNIFVRGINYISLLILIAGVMLFSTYTHEPPQDKLFTDTSEVHEVE